MMSDLMPKGSRYRSRMCRCVNPDQRTLQDLALVDVKPAQARPVRFLERLPPQNHPKVFGDISELIDVGDAINFLVERRKRRAHLAIHLLDFGTMIVPSDRDAVVEFRDTTNVGYRAAHRSGFAPPRCGTENLADSLVESPAALAFGHAT